MAWKFELLTKPGEELLITEGPVRHGQHILFTQIRRSKSPRLDPKTNEITGWRTGTNRTDGRAVDEDGPLFGLCSGGRVIVRVDRDGKVAVVADQLDGKKLST